LHSAKRCISLPSASSGFMVPGMQLASCWNLARCMQRHQRRTAMRFQFFIRPWSIGSAVFVHLPLIESDHISMSLPELPPDGGGCLSGAFSKFHLPSKPSWINEPV
jgi:hypothetical protein